MNKNSVIGLDKIYLHHSVYPNKTTMIDCTGHHNSSGRNGSGKTTLQKLIPIFYGEKVNKVVPSLGTKDPFIKYYLKSEASFIAFEYTNPNGKCCVVLHKKNDHLFYRFFKGSLIDFFYTEESKPVLQKGKLIHEYLKDLKSQGYEISPQISTAEDYRAILQNDKALLRARKKNHKNMSLLELARDYSLSGFNSHMQLMHNLTYALQTRTKMFSGLEDMIVSTQFDFVAPEKPKHVDNKSLSDDLKSLHDFASHEGKIRAAIKKSEQRSQAELEKLRLSRKLKEVYINKKEDHVRLQRKIGELNTTYELNRRRHQETIETLHDQQTKVRSDHKNLNNEIETIHKDKTDWDVECNIQYKKNQYRQINILKGQFEGAELHYQDMTDVISQEKSVFDEKKIKIKNGVMENKDSLDAKKAEILDSFNAFKEDMDYKKVKATDERDEQLKKCRDAYQPRRELLLKQEAIQEQLINSTVETEDERIEYESAEQGKITAEHNEDKAQLDCENIKLQFSDKQQECKQLDSLLGDWKKRVDGARDKERQIHRQRFPDSNSLISFLRSEKSDWAETIGRVIDPELLHKKDLQPVIDDVAESLYGISINLSKVPISSHAANEEMLSNMHKDAEAELERLQGQYELNEKELIKQQEILKQLDIQRSIKDQIYKQAKNEKDVAQKKLEKVRSTNKENKENRRRQAKQDLVELQNRIAQLQAGHEKDLSDIKNQSDAYVMELKGLFESRKSEVDESLDDIECNKLALDEEAKLKIKELDSAFKRVCESKGLDEKEEREAKRRLDEARKIYSDAKSYVDEIERYERWVKNYLNRLPELEENLNKLGQDIRFIEGKIDSEREENARYKKQFDIEIRDLNSCIKELGDLITDAEQLLADMGYVQEGGSKSEENDLFKLIELLRSELKDYKKLTDETLKEVRHSQQLIEKRQESRIFEQWQNLYGQYLARSTYEEYDSNFLLNLPPLFDDLLNNHLPQIKQSTLEAIIGVSGQIDNYYQELKSISNEIYTVSNRLSNRINTNQQIDALSDISIKLISKVEEVGAWKEMESFHRVWSNYASQNHRELPPEELGDALNDVVQALEYAHKNPDLKSMISLIVTLKENGNYKEINSDSAMNDSSSNGLSLLAVIAIYIGMSRYLCPDPNVSLTWPVDELSTIDLENIASLFAMLNSANIRLFSAFPTKEHNILKHFDTCDELDFNKGAMTMASELPQLDKLADKLRAAGAVNGR